MGSFPEAYNDPTFCDASTRFSRKDVLETKNICRNSILNITKPDLGSASNLLK